MAADQLLDGPRELDAGPRPVVEGDDLATDRCDLLDVDAGLQLFRYHLDEALALERPHHLDATAAQGSVQERGVRGQAELAPRFEADREPGGPTAFGSAGRFLADLSTPYGWYCLAGGASERRFKIGYGAGLDDWAAGRFRPLGTPVGPAPSACRQSSLTNDT